MSGSEYFFELLSEEIPAWMLEPKLDAQMMGRQYSRTVNAEKSSTFPSTRWTLVQRLRSTSEPRRQRACEVHDVPTATGSDRVSLHLETGSGETLRDVPRQAAL